MIRVMRAMPNAMVAICATWYLIVHGNATRTLATALGPTGLLWQLGIITTCALCSAWTMLARRPRYLHILGYLHIAAATFMLGYVATQILVPAPPTTNNPIEAVSLTTGLALGSVVIHLIRWLQIEREEIPLLAAIADVAAKKAT